MNFHESPDFKDAIEKAAEHFKMRPVFIEKDYWVTKLLKNLYLSEYKDEVIFKGGTSLSKAFNCIDRFSEDIDLAILNDPGSSDKLKKLIKKIETEITIGFEYILNHTLEEKRGRNRRTFYNYPKAAEGTNFGKVKDTIQLEINAFTTPAPHEKKLIESYISLFLKQNNFSSIINQYSLNPFEINVLSRERTFFEKLSSLIRLSYNSIDELKSKIRHFYDIHVLLNQADLKENLLTDKSFSLLDAVVKDDRTNDTFNKGEWLQNPFSVSPLFKNLESIWEEIDSTYESELREISWSATIPPASEILTTFKKIKEFLIKYDSK